MNFSIDFQCIEKERFNEDEDESLIQIKKISEKYDMEKQRTANLQKELEKAHADLQRSKDVNKELAYCIEYYREQVEKQNRTDDEKKGDEVPVNVLHLPPDERIQYLRKEIERLRNTRKTTITSQALHGYDQTYVRIDLIKQIKKLIKKLRKRVAATKIQSSFRGKIIRRALEENRKNDAAQKIQAVCRGMLMRKEFFF